MEERILRVIFAFIFVIIMKQQLVRINRLIHFDRLKKRRMLEPKTAAEELTSANMCVIATGQDKEHVQNDRNNVKAE